MAAGPAKGSLKPSMPEQEGDASCSSGFAGPGLHYRLRRIGSATMPKDREDWPWLFMAACRHSVPLNSREDGTQNPSIFLSAAGGRMPKMRTPPATSGRRSPERLSVRQPGAVSPAAIPFRPVPARRARQARASSASPKRARAAVRCGPPSGPRTPAPCSRG
jgi:hypothetical protein